MPIAPHAHRIVEREDTAREEQEALQLQFQDLLLRWRDDPVACVCEALNASPDPWQCDVLDALMQFDNVAIRACHGVGKSALLAWAIIWFTVTRQFSKIPTTAPTFNKQVRDILWAEVHRWWRQALTGSKWLDGYFELMKTRLQHRKYAEEWFAVGIASNQPINLEGYHAKHLLAIFDEAKGIQRPTWEAIHGMRTTQEAKLLVASTPGGPAGEFYKVFTQYRQTWRSLFVIHPEQLREKLHRPEAPHFSTGGTYYSPRVRDQFIEHARIEWGEDSPVYTARVVGDFPIIEGDVLIPYPWLSEAEDREQGVAGPRWISCDVARFGRDRTVILIGEGGTILHGEAISRIPGETTVQEIQTVGIGDDPARPRYRAIDVTADILRRLRRQWEAEGIIIDDTGLGGGVTDILRKKGEHVVPINFGAAPTDKSRDAEERASKQRRHLVDSNFTNLKAQMAWKVRAGFETGSIALGSLKRDVLDPLIAQASLMKQELDNAGRIRVIDPDEQEEISGVVTFEGKKSPDHFHSLMLLWWIAGSAFRVGVPRAGQPRQATPDLTRVGHAPYPGGQVAGRSPTKSGFVGGQARWVERRY